MGGKVQHPVKVFHPIGVLNRKMCDIVNEINKDRPCCQPYVRVIAINNDNLLTWWYEDKKLLDDEIWADTLKDKYGYTEQEADQQKAIWLEKRIAREKHLGYSATAEQDHKKQKQYEKEQEELKKEQEELWLIQQQKKKELKKQKARKQQKEARQRLKELEEYRKLRIKWKSYNFSHDDHQIGLSEEILYPLFLQHDQNPQVGHLSWRDLACLGKRKYQKKIEQQAV